jgi:hypothetical protein
MKILYEIDHKCDGCDEVKKTRKVDHLDIRHRHIDHWLCRKCDTSTKTIEKIYKRNQKLHGLGDPFGLKEGCRNFIILSDK